MWKSSSLSLASLLFLSITEPVLAQLIPDHTLGAESSVVTPQETRDLIQGGAARGQNLFHSFQEFNVDNAQQVYFANPVGIENILTRVTGNNVSNILGTLGVDGGANLFLLNPNGIYFGPNAYLDIAGSFHASTADGLILDDGTIFSATNPNAVPLLTLNITPGVQWNGHGLADVVSEANLATGQNLSLMGENVTLNGQFHAPGNLRLQAGETLSIRDEANSPFMAVAGQNLILQGNHEIDIFALNNEASGLFAGNDLILRSDRAIIGDAHYTTGGNFRIENLNGSLGSLLSPNDPVIRASGNVSFDSYTGTSLHIFAGGSVNISGDITINGPDWFNGIAETVTLSDSSLLNINGWAQSTLDIRAGTTTHGVPGIIGSVPNPPNLNDPATSADITIGGNIVMFDANNLVYLSNQYSPNLALAGGTITVGNIDTSWPSDGGDLVIDSRGALIAQGVINTSANSNFSAGDAGNVTLLAAETVTLQDRVNAYAFSSSFYGNAGQGGTVTIASQNGSITTERIDASSVANNNTGNGGAIALTAAGDITAQGRLATYAFGFYGNAGAGGDVTIASQSGRITTQDIDASSFGVYGDSAAGGEVTLQAAGNVAIQDIVRTYSSAYFGRAAPGGNVTIASSSGSVTTQGINAKSDAYFDGQDGGTVSISAVSDVAVQDTIQTFSYSVVGNAGNGGNVTIASPSGSVTTQAINTTADAYDTSQTGGTVSIAAAGEVTTEGALRTYTFSIDGTAGNGGNVQLSSMSGHVTTVQSADTSSFAIYGNASSGGSVAIAAGRGVNVSDLFTYAVSYYANAGNGGSVTIAAAETLQLREIDTSSFAPDGTAGSGGAIALQSDRSIVGQTDAALVSVAIAPTGNPSGTGGDVQLTARDRIANLDITTLSAANQSGSVRIQGTGDLTIEQTAIDTSQELTFKSNRNISLPGQTIGNTGQSGNVLATSTGNLTFRNSRIQGDTQSANPAGNVEINSPGQVTLDQSAITTNTNNQGRAGSVTVNAGALTLTNGSVLRTNTSAQGEAGDLQLNVANTLNLVNSRIEANTTTGAIGNSGSLGIRAGLVNLSNSRITVNSQGQGTGGSVAIAAQRLTLDHGSVIGAESNASQGGNIALHLQDILLMRRGSQISATAGTAGAGGNGGNIDIRALFLVGVPRENSDITANAFTGNGGRITITANQIYGLQFRERLTPLSDITASSEFGSSGIVGITLTNVDVTQNTTELPSDLSDRADQIYDACSAFGMSSFTQTGRGGIVATVQPWLDAHHSWEDMRDVRQTGARSVAAPMQVGEGGRDRVSLAEQYQLPPEVAALFNGQNACVFSTLNPSNQEEKH